MHTPTTLLQLIGSAALTLVDHEISGDSAIEALPGLVKDVWSKWTPAHNEHQRRVEIEALVRASTSQVREMVTSIIQEVAADQPTSVREPLAAYLCQVPATIRHALRRPADPLGFSLPAGFVLEKPDDLLPLLPVRAPRFRPGDFPLPGVDWQLVELLGVGSFGEVWRARNPHQASTQEVALKFCLDRPSAKVLRHETHLLDRLMLEGRHPGIVPLRQTYLGAEPPCLEYEYVAGGDLAGLIQDWHRKRQGPSPLQAAQVVRRLAKIVAFAHRLNPPIVHRDLKPANILVQRAADGSLVLRVADFGHGGVAASHAIRQTLRGMSQAQLHVSALRGACTSLYASPQQMRGADADPRDDVYALGVIWHQVLTGDLSSGRPSGTRWSKRLLDQGMAASLVELLGACFEENLDHRPRTAAVLADQLTEILHADTEPTVATASAAATSLPQRLTNSINLTMMLIPAGTFRMGSPLSEAERGDDEGPQHEVTITRPYYMGIYPVTQRQYQQIMGVNPSYFNEGKGGGPDFPVEKVSWNEAVEFCRRLSALPAEVAAGRVYRLPTEAEWEHACRAGQPTPFPSGLTLSSREANFNGNYPYGRVERGPYLERTTRVGSYSPNPFGLHDMHGNVWEWCSDYYGRTYYRASPRYDPPGPSEGKLRVVRGGSCYNIGRFCRCAYRFGVAPGNQDLDVGLRVVMVPETGRAEA